MYVPRHAFWAEADCGNFGPLLRGARSMRKLVEALEDKWETVEGPEDMQK